MKRGTFVFVMVSLLVACKGSDGGKKRVPDGEKASAAHLIRTIEAVRDAEGGLLLLAEGVAEVCGKGCQCLAVATGAEAGNKAGALYGCPSVCSEDARTKALAAAPGQQLAALAAACTPQGIGLTADTVTQVNDDWIGAFVSGQYLADAYDGANADDRKAYETAFTNFTVPLAPTAGMAGVAVASATNREGLGRSRTFVAIDAKGAIRAGTVHGVRFTPKGAEYVPAVIEPLADAKALRAHLAGGAVAAVPAPGDRPPVQEDPPPPEPEEPDEDESGGTGTAMALEEGKMGKKDSDRAEGQYKMKKNADDPQLARAQAIEQARSAGILARVGEKPGAFATLTGTGDISSGFEDRDVYGGLLGAELVGVVGVTSTPIRDQVLVLADRDAPAMTLLHAIAAAPDGAVLAVEHDRWLAVLPLVFSDGGAFGFGSLRDRGDGPVDLRIELGAGVLRVGNTVANDYTEVRVDDRAALEKAIKQQLDEALFADRRDVKVVVQSDSKVGQLIPALDAALSAGARSAVVESGSEHGGGWGPIGTGTGTANNGAIGRSPPTAPSVSIGQPNAVGDLDKAIIRRYIKRNIPKITYCYEKQLLVKPDLKGTVSTQFFISPSGEVAASSASGVDPVVASCIADVIRTIVFPKPKGGGGVQVNYPFTFRQAE